MPISDWSADVCSSDLILPEIIAKEPLGPLVRHGDNQWGDVVRWTLNLMIGAEEFGVTQANVDEMKATSDVPEVRRMLGVEDKMGEMLGLSPDWGYNIIKQIGRASSRERGCKYVSIWVVAV